MDATQEQWRPVVGHEDSHEVSTHGRVRSKDRTIFFPDGRKRFARGRILKPWIQNGRYHCVSLGTTNGRKTKALVQILVLEAFIGPRPEGLVGCHTDGNPINNHVSNLRWDTYSENNYDLTRHGRHFQANKTHCTRGHEYSPQNTRTYDYHGHTYRYCRQCARDYSASQERRDKRRGTARRCGWKAT